MSIPGGALARAVLVACVVFMFSEAARAERGSQPYGPLEYLESSSEKVAYGLANLLMAPTEPFTNPFIAASQSPHEGWRAARDGLVGFGQGLTMSYTRAGFGLWDVATFPFASQRQRFDRYWSVNYIDVVRPNGRFVQEGEGASHVVGSYLLEVNEKFVYGAANALWSVTEPISTPIGFCARATGPGDYPLYFAAGLAWGTATGVWRLFSGVLGMATAPFAERRDRWSEWHWATYLQYGGFPLEEGPGS